MAAYREQISYGSHNAIILAPECHRARFRIRHLGLYQSQKQSEYCNAYCARKQLREPWRGLNVSLFSSGARGKRHVLTLEAAIPYAQAAYIFACFAPDVASLPKRGLWLSIPIPSITVRPQCHLSFNSRCYIDIDMSS